MARCFNLFLFLVCYDNLTIAQRKINRSKSEKKARKACHLDTLLELNPLRQICRSFDCYQKNDLSRPPTRTVVQGRWPRIMKNEYTCQPAPWRSRRTRFRAHGGNKSFQCERTVVYRESSRSGRWSSKATRDLSWTHCRCCRLLSLSLSSSLPVLLFLSLRAPRLIYSFLRRWLPFFLDFFFISVLLPVFCFRKRQPLIYTPSLHRTRDRARVLLRSLATAARECCYSVYLFACVNFILYLRCRACNSYCKVRFRSKR